eukprot:CAMPEP_0119030404 /NCGR_PEP_ID=MMETSP1176-20130426/41003_1 /TAXON_ID=265551 /ORGANISM="Synedropsis recta cf, Strain CCMP1620" /LENGTH=687 /DNA_ID=CAMNT_0006986773 /DNA_START=1202 /DNA_END=3265 /DNA_ORIENTATION=-
MPQQSRRIKALGLAVIALSSSCTTTTVEGFAVRTTKRSRTQMSSAISYRTGEDTTVTIDTSRDLGAKLVANPLLTQQRRSSSSTEEHVAAELPSWLSVQRSHLMEKNMNKLRETMLTSFYTENEVLKLMFAIEEASQGNRNVMSGAAEFCLVLVETMEMGLSALVAAAFHYCSCVEARQQSLQEVNDNGSFGIWEPKEHKGLQMFGDHSMEIARDASKLKKLEMVFSSIVQNPAVRLSLDSKDADNLRKLLLTDTRDWRALAIRSAACLFRLRSMLKNGDNKKLTSEAVRASREALYIFAPLASRLGMHRLKNELEEAAFQTLYRRQYETVTSLARQMRFKKLGSSVTRRGLINIVDDANKKSLSIGESMKCVLESVKDDMEHVLSSDPVFGHSTESFHVSARVKEPYSLWKKMLHSRADDVLQVPDALALRIVLNAKKMSPDEPSEVTRARERALCYYAQQLCTQNWAPQKGDARFKDYIESPKANGYQSLHYTASTEWKDEEDWNFEIQIRSGEMHKVAEYGLASHWEYKAKSPTGGTIDYSSDSYLRSVQEWHWQQRSGASQWDASVASDDEPEILMGDVEAKLRAERIHKRTQQLTPYLEALDAAQSNLARDHVFVFVSQSQEEGNIMALPSGACVLDALREGNLEWKSPPSLNGSQTNLTRQLRNGDILVVPTITEASVLTM